MKKHKIIGTNITKAITTSAETLFTEQRELIETVFGVPIFDQYGSAEMCVFIGQCRKGKYHINMDYGHVEFIKNNGEVAKKGEEARIICTGVINEAMPFIRYNIGDTCIYSIKKCDCGNPFPAIDKIEGRIDDTIYTPDGRNIGRLSPVLKGFPVKEAQYVQKDVDSIIVRIVKDDGFTQEIEKEIINQLKYRLGDKILFKFEYLKSIKREKGGKFKYVISYLNTQKNK